MGDGQGCGANRQPSCVQLEIRRDSRASRLRSEENQPGKDNLKANIGVERKGRVFQVEGTEP